MLSEKKTFKDLIKSNSKLLIGLSVILFLVIITFLFLDYNNNKKKIKISENYIDAKVFLSDEKYNESLKVLIKIINEKDKIYSPLSLFIIMDKNLEKDESNILEYFNTVLSIRSLEKEDLNLLKLKKAIFVSSNSNEEDMLNLLNPIINSKSVWRTQSIKFLGDYYFSTKEFKKSKQYYSELLKEENLNMDRSDIERKMKLMKND